MRTRASESGNAGYRVGGRFSDVWTNPVTCCASEENVTRKRHVGVTRSFGNEAES